MSKARKSLLILVAAALVAIGSFTLLRPASTNAQKKASQAATHANAIENYDIRSDKAATDKIGSLRAKSGRESMYVDGVRGRQEVGVETLHARVPHLKVEANETTGLPEVIGTDVRGGKAFLTPPSSRRRPDALKDFLAENSNLVGVDAPAISSLKTVADYTNPDERLSFVEMQQEINGIPVFQGEVKAGFTKAGEIVRVVNDLAPGVGPGVLTDFRTATSAAAAAAGQVGLDARNLGLHVNPALSTDQKQVLGSTETAPTAEKTYFPTEPGVVVPAWRVMLWSGNRAYYVVVDAASGALLWRKCLTDDQTQSSSYMVYANSTNMTAASNSLINAPDSPYPLSPGPLDPALATQGSAVGRSLVTLVGNEAPYGFNQLGWISDGNNTTDGNNVQAGLDRKLPNDQAATDIDPDGVAVGSPARTFNFAINPGNPADGTGDQALPAGQSASTCLAQADSSVPTAFQMATTTQLFYLVNRYHDVMYQFGFNEAAHNFQNVNFTGQGSGGDRVSAQAQDCSGTSNANFTTPSDGSRGFMQMYLWPGTNGRVTLDGSLDADVVIHEHTHGLSNRLHGNALGLSTNMARGMGEGWSDFYAKALLAKPTDPVQGVYTIGGYVTSNQFVSFGASNYYYGIRRYPLDVISHTGGVNNKPHNAFTFSYLNSDCNTKMTTANFAFARNPAFAPSVTACDQVHRIGEIWSAMLWEARARFITRLGATAGNQRIIQLVTDGMKLAPIGPTLLTERDAIISAAYAGGNAADVKDLWDGFAARGLGASASIQAIGSGNNNTVVTEAFDLPNLTQTQDISVSDGSGDGDGFAEPGETVSIAVPVTNSTGSTVNNASVSITGGGTTNYGSISGAQTVTQNVSFTVPAGTACGTFLSITININSSQGPVSVTRQIFVGKPAAIVAVENFDSVTAPSLPTGWAAVPIQGGINFVNSNSTSDTAPNAMFAQEPTTVGGGTDLTSPPMLVTSSAATLTFRHSYDTEAGWDGGVLEIAIAGNGFQDILTAGGTFTLNGYSRTLGAGTNNPLAGRSAWSGNSAGYLTTTVQLPPSAVGQVIRLRWRFGSDDNTASSGWRIDTVALDGAGFIASYDCQVTTQPSPPVSLSGRITNGQQAGIRAMVLMTDPQGQTFGTVSNAFGYYILPSIPSGRIVEVKVIPKGTRYNFASRSIYMTAAPSSVNFSSAQ